VAAGAATSCHFGETESGGSYRRSRFAIFL
jgi:hypothetical protein